MNLGIIASLLDNLPDRIADVMGRRDDKKGGIDLDELMASLARNQLARPRKQDVEKEQSTALPADAPENRTRTSKADLYGATQNLFGTLGGAIPGLGGLSKIAGMMGQIRTVSESVRNWYETYQQWQKDQEPPEQKKEEQKPEDEKKADEKKDERITTTPTSSGKNLPVPPTPLEFGKFGSNLQKDPANLTRPAVGNYSRGEGFGQQPLGEALDRYKKQQVKPPAVPSTAVTTDLPTPKTGQETTLWKDEQKTTLYQESIDDALPPKLAKPRRRRGTPVGAGDSYPASLAGSPSGVSGGSATTPVMGGDRGLAGTMDELKESVDRLNETMTRMMSEMGDEVSSGGRSRRTTLEGGKSKTTLYSDQTSRSVPGGQQMDHARAQIGSQLATASVPAPSAAAAPAAAAPAAGAGTAAVGS